MSAAVASDLVGEPPKQETNKIYVIISVNSSVVVIKLYNND